MYSLKVRNVHEACIKLIPFIKKNGKEYSSKNGKVIRLTSPICVEYTNPTERFLFWEERDANPFFHFFESLWMLNGNNNLDFVDYFAPMRDYSDDKRTLNGAYGYRWKNYFGFDQIDFVVNELKNNPNSRRAVISMWDPEDVEKRKDSKDLCCNTQVYFDVQPEKIKVEGFKHKVLDCYKLNMTVLNRSNDSIFGLTGANAVHFSYLQEYIARKLEIKVGSYFQISNNCHVYVDEVTQAKSYKLYNEILGIYKKNKFFFLTEKILGLKLSNNIFNIYKKKFKTIPLSDVLLIPFDFGSTEFDLDLKDFFSKSIEYYINNKDDFEKYSYFSPYFNKVVKPLLLSFITHKSYKDTLKAIEYSTNCRQLDISTACKEWLDRRLKRKLK